MSTPIFFDAAGAADAHFSGTAVCAGRLCASVRYRTQDVHPAPQHVLKAEAQRGAPDATDRGGLFPFLPEPTLAQREWLRRVNREALARRFA